MIKIKLFEISKILESIYKILDKDLPIKCAYSLSKLTKMIIAENQTLEENRIKLLERYGEKDNSNKLKVNENGTVSIMKEHIDTFQEQYNELMNIEVEIDVNSVSIESLGDINVSPKDLLVLDRFIKD